MKKIICKKCKTEYIGNTILRYCINCGCELKSKKKEKK